MLLIIAYAYLFRCMILKGISILKMTVDFKELLYIVPYYVSREFSTLI